MIAGPGLAAGGRRVTSPVNTLDVFSPVIELAGGGLDDVIPVDTTIDSVSLKPYVEDADADADPQRSFVLADVFGPSVDERASGQAIADDRYKLIRFPTGTEDLYNLHDDPFGADNLMGPGVVSALSMPSERAYSTLSATMDGRPIALGDPSTGSDTGS